MMRPVRLTRVAFLDFLELAEQHRADAFLFEVQRDAEHAVRELEHLAGHRVVDAVDARDAVADRDDAAHLGDVDVDGEAADLVADDLGDFLGLDVHLHALHKPFFHLLELPRDAAVVDRAADARDHAADDRTGRPSSRAFTVRPVSFARPSLDRLGPLGVDRRRGRDFRADDVAVVQQRAR